MKIGKAAVAVIISAVIAAVPVTALAAGGVDEGRFTDFNTLTWTTWDGVSTTYGRGPIFSDVHPEITDPEYYLKEAARYPGEGGDATVVYNSQGKPKSKYAAETVEELRKFVNSFDWIHSDELTRAIKVHDRIANGFCGNVYAYPEDVNGFPLLVKGKGMCGEFSEEFMRLAQFVGLECEVYTPSYLHQACLIKISGQWFATDPTGPLEFLSNGVTHPVDYETEKNRFAKEAAEEWSAYVEENPNSWATRIDLMNKQLADGTITEKQYDEMYAALIAEK